MSHDDEFDFDPVALKAKYDEERDKRRALRPEGLAQYRSLTGALEHYAEDPYTPVEERTPKRVETDVVIIGGGFAGMLAAARLTKEGVDDFLVLERGGDFGGTWYWNRYPGAACDVESYIYLPLIEEVGTVPSMKYVNQPEIFAHCQAFGRTFDLYRRALFHTRVTEACFDEGASRWVLTTDRGDELRARFVIVASGHYREPKLPGIPGIETFTGHSFHTSRWDYAYTGGGPAEPMVDLRNKKVGIIGTGATGIQCIPPLARDSGHLYVFQRTPSSVGVRANAPTDPDWWASLEPGWQEERMVNFVAHYRGVDPVDLIQDGWSQLTHGMQRHAKPDMTMEDMVDLLQMVDFEIMEGIRRRIDEVVRDPETAEGLKPWYNWLCKRPCFHDEYLDAFNRDNVTLVDTQGRGIDRIDGNVVVANGEEHELDLLIFATGFELSPYEEGSPLPVTGRDGRTLAEKWKDGATTLHGQLVHGFPNLLLSTTRQASWENNFPFPQDVVAINLAKLIRHVLDEGIATVEVTAEAEAEWVRFHEEVSQTSHARWKECTPSYFNQEGNGDDLRILRNGGFGGSVIELREIFEKWRDEGRPGVVIDEGGLTVQTLESTLVADGLTYGEGPRWHDGKLWFSDMYADLVRTLDADGTVEVGANTPHPSGLGWTPEGDLLVTSLPHALVHRLTPDGPRVHCDLGEFGVSLNDMVVLPDGRAYVDVYRTRGGGPPTGDLALVEPDGTARVVAQGLATPNGLAVTPDGTLVAAETYGGRLTAWTIQADGSLADQRVFADLAGRQPDGVCVDVEGGVWVGCFLSGEFLRVLDGGEITHRVPVAPSWAVAPALGGPDLRTLYLIVNDTTFEGMATGDSRCRIESVEVDVPGAGSP